MTERRYTPEEMMEMAATLDSVRGPTDATSRQVGTSTKGA